MFEGFRPPYADEDVRTGFSGVVVKTPSGATLSANESLKALEQDTIEPTESEVGVSADLDEGTVFSSRRLTSKEDQPKIYEAPIVRKESPIQDPEPRSPVHRSYPSNHQEYSPRIDVITAEEAQQQEHWMNIQRNIDKEYERKLQEVGDEASKKIKRYEQEHRDLLEKTQYLIEHSRVEDDESTMQ